MPPVSQEIRPHLRSDDPGGPFREAEYVEGSLASGTSKETELKLTNVARASFEELLEDYRDQLRALGKQEWPREHRHTQWLRQLNREPDANYDMFKKGIEHYDPTIAANVLIGLIKLTNYLLDRQIRQLEQAFLEEGGSVNA